MTKSSPDLHHAAVAALTFLNLPNTIYSAAGDECNPYPLLSRILARIRTKNNINAHHPHDNIAAHTAKYLLENDWNLSKTRRIAFECLHTIRSGGEELNHNLNGTLLTIRQCCPSSSEHVISAYKSSSEVLFMDEDYLEKIRRALQHDDFSAAEYYMAAKFQENCLDWDERRITVGANVNSLFGQFDATELMDEDASDSNMAVENWNNCCSYFRDKATTSCYDGTSKEEGGYPLRCGLGVGSNNHLILPALREPLVSVRLNMYRDDEVESGKTFETLHIEQEGYLRMFDVSGVLWPAGYLLGLCLSAPVKCGIPDVLTAAKNALHGEYPLAIELGAGVGFPSIAFAKALQHQYEDLDADTFPHVVATDISKSSLALITSNAHINGVSHLIAALEANHTDVNSLSSIKQATNSNGGFHIVIGSSLQALFDDTSQTSAALWNSLDTLLSKDNPNAMVILSHVVADDEKIHLPPESDRLFECVRRVSGDKFEMKTRDGKISDFEIVVLRRKK